MNNPFQDSTLFMSPRSPFARRVRIAFYENGIGFQERVFDVFQPSPELFKANPLGRVPALILKDGQVLIDSSLILQAFYETRESPFMPGDLTRRHKIYHAQSIAQGICEKAVEYYLEKLRPENAQDSENLAEIDAILIRALGRFEETLASSPDGYLVENGGEPTQADFDLGTALAYLKLRYPLKWEENHPHAAGLLARLNKRPSFQKTVPLPA